MKTSFVSTLLLAATSVSAASWAFADGVVAIAAKGSGVGGGSKETLTQGASISKDLTLGPDDTLKLSLTAQEDGQGQRADQVFLNLADSTTGLETSFPLTVQKSGKSKVDITQKDIPIQLLISPSPLSASLFIASSGSSIGYSSKAFNLKFTHPDGVAPKYEAPLRYGRKEEINHIFKPDARSPSVIITANFAGFVLFALVGLFMGWINLGANLEHLSPALSDAPVSHLIYFGGIVGMEVIFIFYYLQLTLLQTLPLILATGAVILISGSKALTEVQSRRLRGER